jgi:ATP-dependent Clp protease ATP-binding subunit ClpA
VTTSPRPSWTGEAQRALARAPEIARELRHHVAGPDHLFLALLTEPGGRGVRALRRLRVGPEEARGAIRTYLRAGEDPPTRTPPLSNLGRAAVALAASKAGGRSPDTGDLLLALVREREGPLSRALAKLGATPEALREAIEAEPADGRGEEEARDPATGLR